MITWWQKTLMVALGGALGCVSRLWLSAWIQSLWPSHFPWGIFVANMLGCLLIGFFAGLLLQNGAVTAAWRAAIIVGFLGGLTTFSSFALDNLLLFKQGQSLLFFFNIIASVAIGLIAVQCGGRLALLFK